ncbi:hypothetical protein LTR84_001160 [Exophiala bonariae]|uniref:Alpha/beta hydrolase fold-3 domain-containing protein n=1 Tax=Exophiala bonariae TaxID=1690606 RepID=A0AAV9NSX7_9EURO|nr:hypothetical protein LTR84_001160 [Exophiala bonariae]
MEGPRKLISSDAQYNLAAFEPSSASDRTKEVNQYLISVSQRDRKWWEVGAQEYRAMREAGKTVFPPYTLLPHASQIDIPSREIGRSISCRIIKSKNIDHRPGIFLHIHGGGWVLGTAKGQDPLLSYISDSTGLTVFSVEYRLAPEHRYPAALHDCEDVAGWLSLNSQATLNAELWFLGGESAGATLSSLALLHLRKIGRASLIKGIILSYGCFDLSILPSLKLAPKASPVFGLEDAEHFYSTYLADTTLSIEDRKCGQVSPMYNDLSGLCPALFLVGTEDPLVDDSVLMHFRWLRAGNQAILVFVPGGVHGFTLLDASTVEIATMGINYIREFIHGIL